MLRTSFFSLVALLIGISWLAPETASSQAENRAERLNSNTVIQTERKAPGSVEQRYSPEQVGGETIMMPMRDGVRLSTTVYQPFLGGPWPVILIRTPYNQEEISEFALPILLAGFVLVTQDTRGRFASEGEDRVFQSDGWGELQDGYDTVEWIAGQSWCDGNVGMWGYSAYGITALMAAAAAPPSLKCMAVGYAPSQGWGQTSYQGGAFRQSLVNEWLVNNDSAHMLETFREHPVNDAFWDAYDIESRVEFIQTPILHIGGFYDCFQLGTLNAFRLIQNRGNGQAPGNQQLIMGPWTHVNHYEREQGELTFPLNATLNEIDELVAWFSYWLKGDENGIMENPPVTYYVMGDASDDDAPGNEWKTAESWPPPAEQAQFFLHEQGALALEAPTATGNSAFPLSGPDFVPTLGGMNLEIPAGPFDQAAIEARSDVLTFETAPLSEPMEVVGHVTAVVYASANLSNIDLSVRVSDVYPDGRSILLCDGIIRASFRESQTNPTPIEPGEVYRYEIDCWATSVVLNRGHRLRISITHSNTPRFEPNPEYANLGSVGHPEEAFIELHHSPGNASYVSVPVVSGLPEPVGVQSWALY